MTESNEPCPLALWQSGRISPQVAIARMLLAGTPPERIVATPLGRFATAEALARVAAMLAEVDHAGPATPAAIAARFDRAVARAPLASVAAYSLDDPDTLARATDELLAWLDRHAGTQGDILDLGCGIGRVAAALAPRARSVLGVDVSPAMVARARRLHRGRNLRFVTTPGTDLAALPNARFDLILAVDSFPYLVQAEVADRHVADAARTLRPAGRLVILNLSYRGRPEQDRADAARWAAAHGFTLEVSGDRPFGLWDGTAFVLARAPQGPADTETGWTAAMRRGDMATAWKVSDAVLASRDRATRDDPSQPYHLRWVWDGSGLDGRDVLVRCYHGLGDTLQFARYLPIVARRAASLTVETQPELAPLLADQRGLGRIIAFDPAAPAPPSECDIEIMELAHALRLPPDAAAPPYLRAAPAALGRGPKLGLCWQAGAWDAARGVPLHALLAAVAYPGFANPGLRLFSLQRGAELSATEAARFTNGRDELRDIRRTASLIAALDLVIAVDTMVAHLAGALGRPTWLLLKHQPDWRWGLGRRTPWYPSLRLYRQPATQDWAGALAEVAADLGRVVSRLAAD